jgi:hypothetical protein
MPFDKPARSPLTGLLAAALLAGCGGGDKPAHDADAPPEDAAEAEAVPMAGTPRRRREDRSRRPPPHCSPPATSTGGRRAWRASWERCRRPPTG